MSALLAMLLLGAGLDDPDPRARVMAYREIAEGPATTASVNQVALSLSSEADPEVRAAGQDALARIDLDVAELVSLLKDSPEPIARAWAAHSLGRQGPVGVDALLAAMQDPSPAVRGEIYDALARSGDPRALQPLRRAAVKDPSVLLRERAAQATLAVLEGPKVQVSAELARLSHPDPGERITACQRLGRAGDWRALEPLTQAASTGDPLVREAALLALGQLGDHRAVPELCRLANGSSGRLRYAAIAALANLADESAVLTLSTLLEDPDPATRQLSVRALAWTDPPGAVVLLTPLLQDSQEEVRLEVVLALGRVSDPARVQGLEQALGDPSPFARAESARLLGSLGSEGAGAALMPLLRDGDPLVRLAAASTLGTLGYRDAAEAVREAAERADDPMEREQLDRIATALGR